MPLGLGRRPDTQGQCNHPTPRDPAKARSGRLGAGSEPRYCS